MEGEALIDISQGKLTNLQETPPGVLVIILRHATTLQFGMAVNLPPNQGKGLLEFGPNDIELMGVSREHPEQVLSLGENYKIWVNASGSAYEPAGNNLAINNGTICATTDGWLMVARLGSGVHRERYIVNLTTGQVLDDKDLPFGKPCFGEWRIEPTQYPKSASDRQPFFKFPVASESEIET